MAIFSESRENRARVKLAFVIIENRNSKTTISLLPARTSVGAINPFSGCCAHNYLCLSLRAKNLKDTSYNLEHIKCYISNLDFGVQKTLLKNRKSLDQKIGLRITKSQINEISYVTREDTYA